MKLFKKLGLSLLILGLGLVGESSLTNTNISYAEEANIVEQRNQLSYAVSDRVNVVSTESFNSYASENAKAAYERAIAEGAAVLEKGEAASMEELALATLNINKAKANIRREVDRLLLIKRLKQSVDRNQTTMAAAKYLLNNTPYLVKGHEDELYALIEKSDKLVQRAQVYLDKYGL